MHKKESFYAFLIHQYTIFVVFKLVYTLCLKQNIHLLMWNHKKLPLSEGANKGHSKDEW